MIMNNLAEYNDSCIDFKYPNNLYQLSDAQKAMKRRYRNEGFNPIQTGLFWSICDWGRGLLGPPPPSVSLEPIMVGS